MKNILVIFVVGLLFVSCSKSPGEGGTATISGKVEAVYVQEGSFDTIEVKGLPDARVYIVYGTGNTQDDDTRTSPDGSFKFEYLNPGDYSVYAYSESLIEPSELSEVVKAVSVNSSQDDVVVPTLTIIQYVK
jgi:hypothetical protein